MTEILLKGRKTLTHPSMHGRKRKTDAVGSGLINQRHHCSVSSLLQNTRALVRFNPRLGQVLRL